MIIWRGWGLLVLVCAGVGLLAGGGLMAVLAGQSYPDNPNSTDLLQALQPVMFGGAIAAGSMVAGVLAWFIGVRMNRDGPVHTLFFIPVKWWGPLFAAFGLVMLATGFTGDAGIPAARDRFVSACEKHEIGADKAGCTCMAEKIEAGTEPIVFVPFYAEMADNWKSRDADENVIAHFFDTYLAKVAPDKEEAFARALDEGAACFGDLPPLEQPVVTPDAPPVASAQ